MTLERAIEIAFYAHRGQTDKQGDPYILHCLRVMLALYPDVDDMIVGVLHDVLEDTEILIEDLNKSGLSPDLCESLLLVTRDKSRNETYRQFIERACSSERSRRIKIADIRDHLARIYQLPEHDQDRLEPRYTKALNTLLAAEKESL